MQIKLFYQTYSRQNFSSADYFNDIVESIDPTYTHLVAPTRVIYYPIPFEEVEESKKKGLLVTYHILPDNLPHLIINELQISFTDISGDYKEVLNHLLEMYGKNATKYQIIEEGFLS